MNWEAIGAIAEAIGALGVIVTLAYLAVQIRQNTASVRASTLQEISEASAGFLGLLASDFELGRIFWVGLGDLEALTPEERLRFELTMLAFVRRSENMVQQVSKSQVGSDEWAGLRANVVSVMSRPGATAWRVKNPHRMNPSFAEWLNEETRKRAV